MPALVSLCCSKTGVTSAAIASLPPTLTQLPVRVERCSGVLRAARFHTCRRWQRWAAAKTGVADASIASLPPTLQQLDVDVRGSITSAVRFAHLVALVELACSGTRGGDEAVASLQALGAVLW